MLQNYAFKCFLHRRKVPHILYLLSNGILPRLRSSIQGGTNICSISHFHVSFPHYGYCIVLYGHHLIHLSSYSTSVFQRDCIICVGVLPLAHEASIYFKLTA